MVILYSSRIIVTPLSTYTKKFNYVMYVTQITLATLQLWETSEQMQLRQRENDPYIFAVLLQSSITQFLEEECESLVLNSSGMLSIVGQA